jgi:hypothetical protein
MNPIADIAMPPGARAGGSRLVDRRPVRRTRVGSIGEWRMKEGLVRRVAPETQAIEANILS